MKLPRGSRVRARQIQLSPCVISTLKQNAAFVEPARIASRPTLDAPWQSRSLGLQGKWFRLWLFSAAVGIALFNLIKNANLKGQDTKVFKTSIVKTACTGRSPAWKSIRRHS
jgi:hypothetical protein